MLNKLLLSELRIYGNRKCGSMMSLKPKIITFFILLYDVLGQFRQVMNNLRILSFCVIIMVSSHQNIQHYSHRNRKEFL